MTHVVHYVHEGRVYAYTPYAREIDVWASLFPTVVIVGPLRAGPPDDDAGPMRASNISVRAIPESGGHTLGAKLRQLALLPRLVSSVWVALSDADAIHVRCPGNLGLIGCVLAPLRSRRIVAKYAGQWGGYAGEPRTVWFQRWLLRSRWWTGPVTVYGRQETDPPHIVPFFTSALDDEQVARGRASAAARTCTGPLRVLFVGRLTSAKRVDALIEAVATTSRADVSHCTIIGAGPEAARLEHLVVARSEGDRIRFAGPRSFDEVLDAYATHDVLVLASDTEGYPKVVAEAMIFGLVVIGSDFGAFRLLLGSGAGLLVAPGDSVGIARALRQLAADPARTGAMSALASHSASHATLSHLGEAIRSLLQEHWPA